MSTKKPTSLILLLATMCLVGSVGCTMTQGIYLGPLAIPVPISPWLQDRQEDKAWHQERYKRTAVLGPLTAESPHIGMDPPSDDQVWRAFLRIKKAEGTIPFLYEMQFDDVQIMKEKITDYIDPPRHLPLVGPVQLHHVNYKCTVHYKEKVHVGWPVPYTTRNDDGQEVIYIDKDHLHMVGNVDTGVGANY